MRAKPISLSKKVQGSNSMKEIVKQNQFTNELLRICISRAEEIAVLKAISDRKTGRLRMQIKLAEKTLLESEYKEEWRLSKEDTILASLAYSKFEATPSKKQLEKISRKMMRIIMQFEDDPSDNDMSLSEVHVNNLMNVKIGPENTYFTFNENGEAYITVPHGSVSSGIWKEQYSKAIKILESCLYGDNINVYNLLSHCVNYGRQIFENEVKRQQFSIEQGMTGTVPLTVFITSKSNANLNQTKKVLSPVRKPLQLPEMNWTNAMFNMLMEQNSEIEKGIKNFIMDHNNRHTGNNETNGFKERDADKEQYRANRAKTYEERPPINPSKLYDVNVVFLSSRFHNISNEQKFNINNNCLEDCLDLEKKMKIIHSCIIIQRYYRRYKENLYNNAAFTIQRSVRNFLEKKRNSEQKLEKVKKMYFWQRLKHWYLLLVNKFRENKAQKTKKYLNPPINYIIRIQKVARGYIDRKNNIYWRKIFKKLVDKKKYIANYRTKQKMWMSCIEDENLLFRNAKHIHESMNACKIQLDEKVYNKREEKELMEVINNFEKTKMESKKQALIKVRSKRIIQID